jgi:hypothetical protein
MKEMALFIAILEARVVEIVTIINTYQWEHNLVKINIVKHGGLLALLSIVGWWLQSLCHMNVLLCISL